jgi:Uma2 family endonuclease
MSMSLILDKPTEPRVKRWTKREYDDLVEKGAFQNQRVYLFRGELIEMPPMGAPHAQCLMKISNWLYATFRPDYEIRIQMPLEVPGNTMLEPDAALITGDAVAKLPHPNSAIFVIEVSDSSIDLDREKAFEYAAAGVAEYWMVDVKARQVEVYRQPVADQTMPLGFRYSVQFVSIGTEVLSPLVKPAAGIGVGELLP